MRVVYRRPFHAPSPVEPAYSLQGNAITAYAGRGYFAAQARVEYLRYPIQMSVVSQAQPEFAPDVNQEICDLAIRTYLERIENPRYRTQLNEQSLNA